MGRRLKPWHKKQICSGLVRDAIRVMLESEHIGHIELSGEERDEIRDMVFKHLRKYERESPHLSPFSPKSWRKEALDGSWKEWNQSKKI